MLNLVGSIPGSATPDVVFRASEASSEQPAGTTQSFAAALDAVAASVDAADQKAGAVALGRGSIADAAIARAKADVLLEVAAVAASRVTGAVTTLLQTQV